MLTTPQLSADPAAVSWSVNVFVRLWLTDPPKSQNAASWWTEADDWYSPAWLAENVAPVHSGLVAVVNVVTELFAPPTVNVWLETVTPPEVCPLSCPCQCGGQHAGRTRGASHP
jgi:hypothetical protein